MFNHCNNFRAGSGIARVLYIDGYCHLLIITSALTHPGANLRRLSLAHIAVIGPGGRPADHGDGMRLADNQLYLL
jgi:hypothetical protein